MTLNMPFQMSKFHILTVCFKEKTWSLIFVGTTLSVRLLALIGRLKTYQLQNLSKSPSIICIYKNASWSHKLSLRRKMADCCSPGLFLEVYKFAMKIIFSDTNHPDRLEAVMGKKQTTFPFPSFLLPTLGAFLRLHSLFITVDLWKHLQHTLKIQNKTLA